MIETMLDESWARFALRLLFLVVGIMAITLVGIVATEGWTESWEFFTSWISSSEEP